MKKNKEIGIVVSSENPQIDEDDFLFCKKLKEKYDIDTSPVIWDGPFSEKSFLELKNKYLFLIFRSCWNYHKKENQFNSWISSLEEMKIKIFNSTILINENSSKFYLNKWIQEENQIQTYISNNLKEIHLINKKFFQKKFVLKPIMSAGSYNTFLFSSYDELTKKISEEPILRNKDIWLLQEYISEIETEGEISLIFFEGQFSHAVKKIPAMGDFRSQKEWGAKVFPCMARQDLIKISENIIFNQLPELPVYCRIDFILTSTRIYVIEIELIEPCLYFASSSKAVDLFCKKLEKYF